MDKVAGGNLDVTLAPLQNSDRLSSAFQKLLAKVSESICAKQDLEKLETAVEKLRQEVSQVKNGKFDFEVNTDSVRTK
jgi:hypothetical protein